MPMSSPLGEVEMSNEKFLKEVKSIVGYGDKNTQKAVRRLVSELGFNLVKGGGCGHYHLTHVRLGGYKATIGSSVSCGWGNNFVSQIRHAMWAVNGR